ncbi:hypothetical protein RchiOBHm_Chr6g0306301 [Rosa chinensis]|uniref:Uncharacterized protein n=1 Tax=Rosa chinensis TaxID=74649 RepID=A0A2P6Q031_ROSCH|nr:hypothetical protein RchiOBHm_Chr6g0306301 [Rosa chinensis]
MMIIWNCLDWSVLFVCRCLQRKKIPALLGCHAHTIIIDIALSSGSRSIMSVPLVDTLMLRVKLS